MTRQYLWELMKQNFIFWFSSNPVEKKEVCELFDNSLLVPKPKFKVGDRVTFQNDRRYRNIIAKTHYSVQDNSWTYEFQKQFYLRTRIEESELELVERKEE